MEKFLKILFIILVVITIGEFGYYLFLYSNSTKGKTQQEAPIVTPVEAQLSQDSGKKSLLEAVVDSYIIDFLTLMKKNEGAKLSLVGEQPGIIESIVYQQDDTVANIKIVDENKTKVYQSLGTKDYWNKRLFRIEGESKIPVSLTELKVGDRITYKYVIDLINQQDPNAKKDEFIVE